MDQIILNLSHGLGLQSTIGYFLPIFIGVSNVLPSLLSLFQFADKSAEFNKESKLLRLEPLPQIYDFIIVGAGTSGSVLAHRLSENYSVLVLERGGKPNPLTQVPGLESQLIRRKETDYMYLTVPQNKSCFSMINRQSPCPRGASLGGTSTINSMVYARGHPYDFDVLSFWLKDKRWSYQNVLSYFLKSESYCFTCDPKGMNPTHPAFHGTEGPLHLQKPQGNMHLVQEFISAMNWAGVPKADLNSPFIRGVDTVTYTQKDGRRMTTKDAFLKERPKLKITKYARVFKVLFDENKRAYGVEYEQFGNILRAGVTKEVILSAGVFDSPKILMLSGIGQQLEQFDIPIISDLPVGQSLQDHVGVLLGPFLINKPNSFIPQRDLTLDSVEEFLKNGTGILSLSFAHAVAVFPSSKAELPMYPDIQVGLSSIGIDRQTAPTLARIYNINEEILREFYGPLLQQRDIVDSFNLIVNHGRPKSRGWLKLKSADFRDDLEIEPNYFSDESDLEALVEGLKIALEVAENAPSFRKLKTELSPFPWPKCLGLGDVRSEPYLKCLAQHMTLSLGHFVGTARMGEVLDSEFRVKGVKGIRVIDSSAIPFITTMNTMAPTLLMAEMGARFILEEWNETDQEIKLPQGTEDDYEEVLNNYDITKSNENNKDPHEDASSSKTNLVVKNSQDDEENPKTEKSATLNEHGHVDWLRTMQEHSFKLFRRTSELKK